MDSSLKNPSYYYHPQSQPPFPPPPPIHHPNHHHRQNFPPINPPPPYYSLPPPPPPPHVSYESPWIPQRIDSRIVNPNYQLDYGNRTRVFSNCVLASDFDCNSRFRDGFSSLGYKRTDFDDVRVENQGCVKDDYYHSEIERHFDNGNQGWIEMSKDGMNGTSCNRSRDPPADCGEKRFKSFKVKRMETRCVAGNVLFGEVTRKKEGGFPLSTSSGIENLSRGYLPVAGHNLGSNVGKYTCMDNSGSETVIGSEFAPLETQAGCKMLPNDHLGCGSSDVVCSIDKDMVDDSLRISSCLVPATSVSLCPLSPSVSVNEQTQNSASSSSSSSSVEANRTSQCGITEKERGRPENMDLDIQKENVKPIGETSQCRTSDSEIKTTLSAISEKTQNRANKYMHAALYDTKKDANSPINVTKHRTWHRKSDTFASPLIAVKPKVTVRSSSTYIRKGNSLLRKPSSGSLGEAQTLQRPLSDSTSSGLDPRSNGLPGSSSGEADDPDSARNRLKSFNTLIQTGYASESQPKPNPSKLTSPNSSKMLYAERKANQLVADSDIGGTSRSEIPHSGGYFKRSKNQLVRNPDYLVNQLKSLSDDALYSQTGEKMVSKKSCSSALSEYVVSRPFNQSNFSLVRKEPLSRKASRVHISHQKIVPQPALVLRNGYYSTIGRNFLMMRKRRTIYRRSTNEHSLKRSKVLGIGGSHLNWSKSVERDSKKSEFLSDFKSSCSGLPECGKYTKRSFIPRRLVTGNVERVWTRNGNLLAGDPRKRSRVLANEKVRWSLNNIRLRPAKKWSYCQFFTRFGKCNKDDGKCPYIHDPSKIAVCTKFVNRLCANPDCKLTHKVVPERMPDCSYFLQGLCNNEPCLYRHVHVNQNAAVCEGFLRGYCSDGNECRKKHTYTCPVFEATGNCPEESECKLHHPKNQSKGKTRKRANEPWQNNPSRRYFSSMHNDLPESAPMLINELAADGAVFGGEGLDFIQLDVNEHEASENMESVSDDSEAHDSIDELIRPAGLMQM